MSTSSCLRFALCLVLATASASCSGDGGDEPGDAKPVPGSQPTMERWIVSFASGAPNLAAYRKAVKDDLAAVPGIVASLREQQQQSHAEFATTVDSVGGKIVDWWWMSNAATVEVEPSALATIKKIDGVKSVVPDRLLE